jgi:hypothetical protein
VGAVALGDQLFVCGGFDGISSLDTVEKFDPVSNCWTLVASMTKNRSAAGIYVDEQKLMVLRLMFSNAIITFRYMYVFITGCTYFSLNN